MYHIGPHKEEGEIKVRCAFGDILEQGELLSSPWNLIGGNHQEPNYRTVLQEVLVRNERAILGVCPYKHIINFRMEFDGPFDREEVEVAVEFDNDSDSVWTNTNKYYLSNSITTSGMIPQWYTLSSSYRNTGIDSNAIVTWNHSSSSVVPLIIGSGQLQ